MQHFLGTISFQSDVLAVKRNKISHFVRVISSSFVSIPLLPLLGYAQTPLCFNSGIIQIFEMRHAS